MNELTEGGPLSLAVARRYGVPGEPQSAVSTLATDLFPMVQMSDEQMDVELHFLAGSKLAGQRRVIVSSVAQFAHVALLNPADSGVLIVPIQFTASSPTAMTLQVQVAPQNTQTVLSLIQGTPLDARWAVGTTPELATGQMGTRDSGTIPGTLVQVYRLEISVDRIFTLKGLVLGPGDRVFLVGGTANTSLDVSIIWRERRIGSWETDA